jgi:hypothetical protein
MRIFHTPRAAEVNPLLAISAAVFELEKLLRHGSIARADIHLAHEVSPRVLDWIAIALKDLVRFTLVEEVDFEFHRGAPPPMHEMRTEIDLAPTHQVCLFSGGVDSYVGLSLARQKFENVNAVFCAHQDQSKINHIVNHLYKSVFRDSPPLRLLSVPAVGKHGYAQLRGFLYFVAAASWMQLLRASTLIITECGPTMYQPKFGPLDRVTLTTHPYVVSTSKYVIEALLGRKIRILTPFENLTKAEVMTLLRGSDQFAMTHSCISQRFGGHDGTCYGCVVRRLAALAAGIADVQYRKNPLQDENANRGNLLALLRFNLDFLADWRSMQEYEVGEIYLYGKMDLFRRFALDNFAAIHRLVAAREPVAEDVLRIYGYALDVLRGSRPLVERLRILREGRVSPVWRVRRTRDVASPFPT